MKLELERKLFEKYPKIFRQKNLPMEETCMCWGIECGDGWLWLIDNLCQTIQSYLDFNRRAQVEAVQVKEKYGGLRFYVHDTYEFSKWEWLKYRIKRLLRFSSLFPKADNLVDGMVWFAEHLSFEICEQCGSTEEVSQSKGWIKTRCERCRKVEG